MTSKRTKSQRQNPLGAWLKKHHRIIAFSLIFGLLTWERFYNFLKPISFENYWSWQNAGLPTSFLTITYTTRWAFLPAEKIHIHIKYGAIASNAIAIARKETRMHVLFDKGFFTDNDINRNQYSRYTTEELPKTNVVSYFIQRNLADITLKQSSENDDLYEGDAEIFYEREGEFYIYWFQEDAGIKFKDLETKIKIPSMVDVMNKRTNDMLFIIAVLGVLIPFYIEFRKKPASQPLIPTISDTKHKSNQ